MRAALARIDAQHEALLAALDGNDVAAIERGSAELGESLANLKHFDTSPGPELRPAVMRIRHLADAGTMRVNLLADHSRRRSEALAAMRWQAVTYTR